MEIGGVAAESGSKTLGLHTLREFSFSTIQKYWLWRVHIKRERESERGNERERESKREGDDREMAQRQRE